MLLSKSSEYGLRASLYLTTLHSDSFVSIREISQELEISFHFLTKIFQKLTSAGILHSFRGPNGGVALARPSNHISLYEIIVAIDGDELFTQCALGLAGCGEDKECPMHEQWGVQREQMRQMFADASLADTAERIQHDDLRLKLLIDDSTL